MSPTDDGVARDLADVECWHEVRRGVRVRLVDASPLISWRRWRRLVIAVPAPDAPTDAKRLRADTTTALRALGWRCLTVEVARPARVHRHVTAHRRLSGTARVDAAIHATARRRERRRGGEHDHPASRPGA